jgi:hypothetical protein
MATSPRRRLGRIVLVPLALAGCAKKTPPPQPPPVAAAPEPIERPVVEPKPDDDGMSVSGTLGTVDDAEIAQAYKARWSDVTRCLREAAPRLGYLGGKVEIKVRLGKGGVVKTAHVQDSTLGHYAAERCLVELTSSMQFPTPRGGVEAEFAYPVEFKSARPWLLVEWPTERLAPEQRERNLTALKWCRTAEQKPPPTPPRKHRKSRGKGKQIEPSIPAPSGPLRPIPAHLRLTVYVAPGGKVVSGGLSGDGPVEPAVGSCMVSTASAWKLDDPGGRPAKVALEVEP